jgi:predicted O-methyltransferase YrrM
LITPSEIAQWYEGKDFTSDWTSHNFPNWCRVFEPGRQKVKRILEIGSWEGRSAIFFLEFFPNASITCVDTFHDSSEYLGNPNLPLIEERFDVNMSAYGARVTKIVAESIVALHTLIKADELFDLIYVDGSHNRDDVLIDSLLSWRLSRSGTIIVWDDYEGGALQPHETRLKIAINLFLSLYPKQIRIVHRGYQIIAERLA